MADPFTYRSIYWVWLHELRGIPLRIKRILLQALGSPKAVFHASFSDITTILQEHQNTLRYVSETTHRERFSALWSQRNLKKAQHILTNHEEHDIKTLCGDNWRYRDRFEQDRQAPLVLYYRGNLLPPDVPVVGVIGSRSCTSYGRKVTKAAVKEAVAKQEIVASGLSIGIDALAHETTIALGGTTYAFIPNGLHTVQPASQERLMENIIAHGAVLTPYPYGKEALPFRFIQRNGILASWCDPLIVVEARLKSGSVLTARKALSKGKRVLAVPNSLLEPRSGGTNQLLTEGATAYLNAELLDNHNGPIMQGNQNQVVKIITALEAHPLGTGELVASVGDESSLVMESLAAMELAEQIEYRSDGKWHRVGGP